MADVEAPTVGKVVPTNPQSPDPQLTKGTPVPTVTPVKPNGGTSDAPIAAVELDAQGARWPDNWRAELAGNDEKALKRLERFQSPTDIFKSYRALEQRLSTGELKSAVPKTGATEAEVAAWRTENGIPDAPEKYDLKLTEGFTIGAEDKPVIDTFLKSALGANLNNQQASAAVDWYYAEVERQAEVRSQQDEAAAQKAQDDLRGEWGQDYRRNMTMNESLLDMAPTGLKDNLKFGRLADGTPLWGNADFLRFMNQMAREINPVSTVLPGHSGNIEQGIDGEIATIETKMKTDRKGYNADAKMQERYRELLDAKARMAEKGKAA